MTMHCATEDCAELFKLLPSDDEALDPDDGPELGGGVELGALEPELGNTEDCELPSDEGVLEPDDGMLELPELGGGTLPEEELLLSKSGGIGYWPPQSVASSPR